jgi:hypothetical protein
MSKRLPYFQFEPAEYLAGDIMFCSYSAQGIFNTICALYWQKDCDLKYSQVVKRLGNEDLIKELISEKIIKVENDTIIINFLDEQYLKATEKSRVNSSNGSKGALKRWAKNSDSNSEIIATPLKNDSESIALREEKIKEKKIKEDNTYRSFVHLSITNDEVEKLKENYDIKTIDSVLDSIENYKDNKKYKSLYLTAKKWLEKEPKKDSLTSGYRKPTGGIRDSGLAF